MMAILALGPGRQPAVRALDDPKKARAQSGKTPKEQFQAVLDAYQEAQRVFSQAYSKARPPKSDRRFSTRSPPSPTSTPAVSWRSPIGTRRPRGRQRADLVRPARAQGRHIESHDAAGREARGRPQDGPRRLDARVFQFAGGRGVSRAVIEKNRDRTARGNATMALAKFLKNRVDLIASLRGDDRNSRRIEQLLTSREGYDQAALARLKATDSTALSKEIESLFEQVVKDFGDINVGRATLGKQAAGELNEIRSLGVGRPCPEIVGEDIDGKSFKLSDYRGKVVVIDFWGDW